MTPIEELRRDHENALTLADKDHSDLRHSNPGRLSRQARERSDAATYAMDLRRAIDIAERLDFADIPWTRSGRQIHFLLKDGTTVEVKGDAGDTDRLDRQFEAMENHTGDEQRNALLVAEIMPDASRDLKWIRDRMEGVSAPKFRKVFLVEAGLLEDHPEGLEMTELALAHDMLKAWDGEFGPWFTATGLGTAWIYACYLAENIPMTSKAKGGPRPNVELDAILVHHEEALEDLPDDLRALADRG